MKYNTQRKTVVYFRRCRNKRGYIRRYLRRIIFQEIVNLNRYNARHYLYLSLSQALALSLSHLKCPV